MNISERQDAELTVLQRGEQIARWLVLKLEKDGKDKLAQIAPVSSGGRGKESGVRAARALRLPEGEPPNGDEHFYTVLIHYTPSFLGMFMRGRRVFMAGFAMFVSRLRMLFGFFMLAHVMMMSGLMVVMSGSVMVSGCLMMVLARRMR
jgi:hypothetical protein